MAVALEQLRRNGFRPSYAIDVGAFTGDWAAMCRRRFPEASVLMIEPGPERVAALRDQCRRDARLSVSPALVGASVESVAFREAASNSGIAHANEVGTITMQTTTLDQVVSGTPFTRPQLLKIDVQGY